MSQDFMDPELFSDFIIEAKEHLETIEPNLLELEKAPDNLALLNEIFRPMHSLKGASGFLGLNKINHLAHKAENILDELRKGEMVITSEIMDVILSATDALRQMIDNLERTSSEGDVETESIMDLIDNIMKGELDSSSNSSVSDKDTFQDNTLVDTPTSVIDSSISSDMSSANNDVKQSITIEIQEEGEKTSPISSQEWISTREPKEAYVLSAFGEEHLKDFISEAVENTENLTTGLLTIEKDMGADPEVINDIFRYFHNLKGNSGIIGFQELNSLTHEAETLLNKIRHGEQAVTNETIDLLLFVVDVIENLVNRIESTSGKVQPFDISEILTCLKEAVAGNRIVLPTGYIQNTPLKDSTESSEHAVSIEEVSKNQQAVLKNKKAVSLDREDEIIFVGNVIQQRAIMHASLEALTYDASQKDIIDALYRALSSIQKAANFVGLEELQVYTERTAALVAQGRDSDIDFSLMLDILKQEISIVNDMIDVALTAKNLSPEELDLAMQGMQNLEIINHKDIGCTAEKTQPEAENITNIHTKDEDKHTQVDKNVCSEHEKAIDKNKSHNATTTIQKSKESEKDQKDSSTNNITKVASFSAKSAESSPTVKATPAVDQPVEQKVSSTIRVDHEKLDHLMNLIGELIINRNRYTMLARHLEEHGSNANVSEVAQNLSETTYALARISDELQDTIMKVRMVPVASVFSRFPRLVRDLSRKSGKEVDLILDGEETELDKSVVEVIGDPLVHLVRNSVDHGIESEDERRSKGKPLKGKVNLRAYHKGNSVAIEIEDDGKGLDPEKLKNVAISKGILSVEDAKQLSDREAMDLIFAPGFSSAEKITDISGRGVGMDVVRTNIKSLKGSISINSEIGKGTCFTLSLPLTLAIIDALMVNVSGEVFAIPLDAVSETTKLDESKLTDINGRKAVILRGEVVGLIELSELLNLPQEPRNGIFSIVIIHNNERRIGLVVDKLLERQEIVIKPLGSYLGDIQCISGATIMGDGGVILILDPHEIYSLSTSFTKAVL